MSYRATRALRAPKRRILGKGRFPEQGKVTIAAAQVIVEKALELDTNNSRLRAAHQSLVRQAEEVASGVLLLSTPHRLSASDHIDSPTVAQDRGSDIADMWAFLDPNDNSKLVLRLSTQGFIVSGEHFGMVMFDHNIRYRFEIENTGDAKPDSFIDVTYSPGVGRLHTQIATISSPNGRSFTAPTTLSTQEPRPTPAPTPVVTTDCASGVSFFAGVADDPFFLDDTGANRFVACSLMNPGHPNISLLGERGGRHTYAGFNPLITALEVPVEMLRGPGKTIGINAVTQRQQQYVNGGHVEGSGPYMNIDRQGNPLVNNGLIPATRKDEYNGASTAEDAAGRFLGSLIWTFHPICSQFVPTPPNSAGFGLS